MKYTFLNHFLILVLSVSPFFLPEAEAQRSRYKSKLDEGSRLIYSQGIHTVEKTKEGKYVAKQYFYETKQVTNYVTYKNKKGNVKDGLFTKYWDDGTLVEKGTYKDDVREGEWVLGNYASKGNYKSGLKEGEWIVYDSSRTVKEINQYKKDELHGNCKYFNKAGDLTVVRRYEQGELLGEEYLIGSPENDSLGKYEIVEQMPMYTGCEDVLEDSLRKACANKKMLTDMYSKIKYPAFARENSIQGIAQVRFVIDENGDIQDIKVLNGLCSSITKVCRRVVENMPSWNPGTQYGEAVKVYFNLPISFRLE